LAVIHEINDYILVCGRFGGFISYPLLTLLLLLADLVAVSLYIVYAGAESPRPRFHYFTQLKATRPWNERKKEIEDVGNK
jgi:hypothetical protein